MYRPCAVRRVILRPASQTALKTVVATCETPPPTPSSYSPSMITGAGRKPRSSVRGPTLAPQLPRPGGREGGRLGRDDGGSRARLRPQSRLEQPPAGGGHVELASRARPHDLDAPVRRHREVGADGRTPDAACEVLEVALRL